MTHQERFSQPLPVSVADQLRSEAQSIEPGWFEIIRQNLTEAKTVLEGQYAASIHPEAHKRNRSLQDRVIVQHDIWSAYDATFPSAPRRERNVKGSPLQGFTNPLTGLIYLADPRDLWNAIDAEEKEVYFDLLGDKREAQAYFMDTTITQAAIHEGIHQYQPLDLPMGFREMGARYYEQDVVELLDISHIYDDLDRELARAYGKLLYQFGPDVHNLAFGTRTRNAHPKDILRSSDRLADGLIRQGYSW